MSPLEINNPTTVDPEKCNTAEAQDKGFKTALMLEVPKRTWINLLMKYKKKKNQAVEREWAGLVS